MTLTSTKIAVTSSNLTLAGVFAAFWLSQVAISLLALLIIIDSITGFTKACLNWNATSNTAARWLLSKASLLFIPISISATWIISDIDVTAVVSWVISMLAFAELYSIVANIYEIKTKEKLPEYDAVSHVIAGILKVIRNILDTKTK